VPTVDVPSPPPIRAAFDPAHPPSRYGVLRHKHYRNVLGAQFLSNVGTWMEMFAMQMVVAKATGSLADLGVLTLVAHVPIFLLGAFGGLMADRFNRRTLLIVTQIMLGFVAVGVAVVSSMEFDSSRTLVHWLLIFATINGVIAAFNFPAWQVLTPRLVPKGELTKAITLNGIQFNLARVIGPGLAGLMLASLSATPLFVFNAFSFFAVAAVVMTTPDSPPAKIAGDAFAQLREAFRFLVYEKGPRAVLIAQVLISMLAAPLVRMLSLFVIDVFGLGGKQAEQAGGLLLSIQGVGAVIGGLCLRYIPAWYPRHHFIPLSAAALGLSISLFAVTTNLVMGCIAMLICGFFWIWSFNQSWAAMQVLAPDALRGRVMSLTTVASFGATALGAFVAGYFGESLKHGGINDTGATQASVAFLSLPLFIAGLVMLIIRTPEVDGDPRPAVTMKARRTLWNAITAREHRPVNREGSSDVPQM